MHLLGFGFLSQTTLVMVLEGEWSRHCNPRGCHSFKGGKVDVEQCLQFSWEKTPEIVILVWVKISLQSLYVLKLYNFS